MSLQVVLSHWVPIPKIDSEKPEDQKLIHVLKNGRQEIEQLDEYLQTRETRVTRITSGPVNEEVDREFLRLVTEKDFHSLRKWSSEYIEENLGNGGQEIHNWLVLFGALQSFETDVAFYEPIPEWVTGMAIVQFNQPVDPNSSKKSSKYEINM